jgi:Protein of unknown function (DUF1631)
MIIILWNRQMSAIIHKFSSSSNKNNTQLKRLAEKIEDCLNEELSELIGHMFNGADDMLFQLAENADSNEEQTQHFDTMRMLRTERTNVSHNFADNIKAYLQPTQKKDKPAFDEEELSLVDQSEMEELVAVSAMHSKAMGLYGEAVNHLEARIEFLSLKVSNVFPKDALTPKNICESFKDALSDIELSTNNKLILYKLFDQEVVLHLAALYQKLNQIFIDLGILPQIKLGDTTERRTENKIRNFSASTPLDEGIYSENPMCDPAQSSSYQVPNNNRHGGHGTLSGTPSTAHSPGNIQQEINRVASQFIQGELTASGPGVPSSFTTNSPKRGSQGAQYYDRRDVMKALSNLQHKTSYTHVNNNQPTIGELKQALLTNIGAQSGGAITKQVSQVDEKTIDLIEMLFNAIIDDDSIPELVTNLLLRLQIPVIKAAMIDEDFITSDDHPCKTTLNIIAHLGRGISSQQDELFTDLENIIDNILNEFDVDISSFEKSVDALEIIEDKEFEKAAQTERQTQKSVLQAHAREMVLTELQHHVKNKTLAKPAQKLILRNWSTLMFHRYIKFGKDSDEWRKASTSIKQLIHLLQPIESPQAYYTVEHEKNETLDYIQNSLLDTRQNPVEVETEINNVYNIIDNALSNSKFNPAVTQEDETYFSSVNTDAELDEMEDPTIDFEDEIDPLQEQAKIAREKIAGLASDIRPGVWFKVFNGDDSPARRAKLSVIVMEEAKLVFVDRVGVKVIEKDAAIFNEEINTEKSSFLADHSAFDHALGVVINSLSGKN